MSGYVFHCTPCGIAHAGECPPKARDPFYAGPGSFETVELPQILGRAARGGTPQLYVPNNLTPSAQILPGSHNAYMPMPHTMWKSETRSTPGHPWGAGNTGTFYEALQTAAGLATIRSTTTGLMYQYPLEHWRSLGAEIGGMWMRFVPAP
jgi:hypothetical protein